MNVHSKLAGRLSAGSGQDWTGGQDTGRRQSSSSGELRHDILL